MRPMLLIEMARRRSVEICAAASGAVCLLALWSWGRDAWDAAAWGHDYVPMAPSTAWLMLLLSVGLLLHRCWPAKPAARGFALTAVCIVAAAALAVGGQALFGFELPVERWLAPTEVRVREVPIGRMSPLTAVAFVTSALALGLELRPLGRRRLCRRTASLLAAAVLLLSLSAVLSYAVGVPLLYDGQTIPMALPTAVSFALLSWGLLAAAGAGILPWSSLAVPLPGSLPSRRHLRGITAAFVGLMAAVGAAGYFHFTRQLAESRRTAEDGLWGIANLQVRQILDWREERLAEARELTEDQFASEQVRRFLARPPDGRLRASLVAWLKGIQQRNHCLRVVLLDPQLHVRLAYPEDRTYFGPIAEECAAEALRSRRVAISDLHRSRKTGEVHLDLAGPLFLPCASSRAADPASEAREGQLAGVIAMEVDPARFLYPRIRQWPTSSGTAETLLVRREGDEVVFLNEVRHRPGTALSLRLPIDGAPGLPEAMVVAGHEGVVQGRDYRNVPVLAGVRDVPGTPWFIVAKVDQKEIFAPMRERARTTGIILLGIVLTAALGVGLLARQRDNQWLCSQLAVERERQAILESADEGIIGLDGQGRCVFANAAAARMLGCQPAELTGKHAHAALRHKRADGRPLRPEECPICRALGENRVHHSDEETFWRKDGTPFPVEHTCTPTGQGGRGVAAVLTFSDITARKRAEQSLRDQTARLATVIGAAQDAIIMLDVEGKIALWNDSAVRIFGYSAGEAMGRDLHRLLVPERFREAHSRSLAEFRRSGMGKAVGRVLELAAVRKSGEEVPIELSLSAVQSADGWQAVGILRDITGRKRAEEALQEALRQSIRHQAGTASLLEAAKAVLRHREFKDAARRIFDVCKERVGATSGYVALLAPNGQENEVLFLDPGGLTCSVDPSLPMPVRGLRAVAYATGKPAWENDFARSPWAQFMPAGHVPLRNAMFAPLVLEGRAVGLIGLANKPADFTQEDADIAAAFGDLATIALSNSRNLDCLNKGKQELEQYAEALESANQALEQFNQIAESATRAKSQFLANMSHEIRTPMTAILGYTDLLLEESPGLQATERLEVIKRNGEHLLQLINDILDLSKIEAGKLRVEQTPCSPAAVLSDVAALMEVRATAKGVALRVDGLEDLPKRIRTDPVRFRQIMVNLVGNAVKFTERGEVRLTARAAHGDEPLLQCDVCDTGIGLSPEQAARLFQPFMQAESGTARKFGGTGLGLAISKNLAERLGGTVVLVSSQPGAGSHFRLTLPLIPVDAGTEALPVHVPSAIGAAGAGQAPPAARPLADRRILLAEDGPDNQRLIALLLNKAGAEVTVVENGQTALDAALTAWKSCTPFDVVLMDMQMPVVDGYQATAQLRAAGYDRPIVALTAHAMREDRQRCLDAGCDDYASKPLDRKRLLEVLAQYAPREASRVGG